MAQPDTAWMEKSGGDVDDDGVQVRGQYLMRQDGPPPEWQDPLPGLWIGHADGISRHFLEIQEFGDDSRYPNSVAVEREEIPKVVDYDTL